MNKVGINRIRQLGLTMILLIATIMSSFAQEAESQLKFSQVDLSAWNFEEAGLFTFSNNWEYYPNRIIHEKDFKAGTNLGLKEFVRIPEDFYNQQSFERKYKSDYGTLRTVVKIPRSYIGKTLSIRSTLFYKDASFFVNGKEVFSDSTKEGLWADMALMKPQMLGTFVANNQNLEIIIHFYHQYNFSNSYGGIYLGEADQVQRQMVQRLILDTFIFSSLLVLAIFNFTFFLRNNRKKRNEKLALYFALLVGMMAIRVINSGEHYLLYFLPSIPGELISKLGYWAYYLLMPLFVLFACEVRKEMLPPFVKRISLYALGFFGLFVLMVDSRIYTQLKPIYMLYFILVIVQLIIHTVRAMRLKVKWVRTEFLAFAMMLSIFILDSFYISGHYHLRNYYLVSILIFMIYVTHMVSKIYASSVDQLENLLYSHDQLTSEIERLEKEYTENLLEKQRLCDGLIEQKNIRLSALERVAQEMTGTMVIVDENLRIKVAYGLGVEKHLGVDYIGEKFIKYFFGEQTEAGQMYVDILRRVISLDSVSRVNTYLSLLPKQTYKQGRYYAFETQLIKGITSDNPVFAIVVTDINKFERNKQQVEKSEKALKLVSRYAQFSLEIKYLVMRLRSFQYYELETLIEKNHSVEELIEKLIMTLERFSIWYETFGFESTHMNFRNFILELDRLQKEVVPIQKEDVYKMIQDTKLDTFDSEDYKLLQEYIAVDLNICSEALQKELQVPRELREAVDVIRPYCEVLAKRYGKMIEPVIFEGQSPLISFNKAGHVFRSLSKLFESMVVHSIEYYDERNKLNKPISATLRIRSTVTLTHLILEIEDDGTGININTLKDSLYKLNLMSFKEIVSATDEKVLPYIFEKDVYYREADNEYFGIGDGLWQVKETIERYKGSIRVESSFQSYCRFIIEVPLEEITP